MSKPKANTKSKKQHPVRVVRDGNGIAIGTVSWCLPDSTAFSPVLRKGHYTIEASIGANDFSYNQHYASQKAAIVALKNYHASKFHEISGKIDLLQKQLEPWSKPTEGLEKIFDEKGRVIGTLWKSLEESESVFEAECHIDGYIFYDEKRSDVIKIIKQHHAEVMKDWIERKERMKEWE